jgi:hypothetical protein
MNIDVDLSKFFAWARARAYNEFEQRMAADPKLDPNWTFSDIMQDLLAEYRQLQASATEAQKPEA